MIANPAMNEERVNGETTRNHQHGQAVQEYGITLVLVAVLCIGALTLLGGNVRDLFSRTISKTSTETNKAFATLNNAGTDISAAAAIRTAEQVPTEMTLSIDPATGQVIINAGNVSDKNATSVDGSAAVLAMADQLKQLASFKTSDGQELPPDLQLLLGKLGQSGTVMGGFYQSFETNDGGFAKTNQLIAEQAAAGQFGGPPYYDPQLVQAAMQYTDNYLQFGSVYQKIAPVLDSMAQSNPEYAALKQQVEMYAGGISNTTHNNVGIPMFSEFHMSNINPADLAANAQAAPYATQFLAKLAPATANMTPQQKDEFFRQAVVSQGKQLLVGTPVTGSGLSISLTPPSLQTATGG